MSLTRSITFNTDLGSSLDGCKLIRVLNGDRPGLLNIAFNLINLRYVNFTSSMSSGRFLFRFPPTFKRLWNLQTLIIRGIETGNTAPPEIWEMKQLREIYMDEICFSPPNEWQEDSRMRLLHTLVRARNLTCSEGVVKRIPNVKKLHIFYDNFSRAVDRGTDYCLANLQHLNKLESLHISLRDYWCSKITPLYENLILPVSLKRLILVRSRIPWEQMMMMIGCLPNLQVLKLHFNAFVGEEWNPIEGQFISLKFMLIDSCEQLKFWNADSIHFPVLEKLVLAGMRNLEEIPVDIGEIPPLRSIILDECSDSLVRSAMYILDEQQDQGNVDLKIEVRLRKSETQLMKLETRDNFIVKYS